MQHDLHSHPLERPAQGPEPGLLGAVPLHSLFQGSLLNTQGPLSSPYKTDMAVVPALGAGVRMTHRSSCRSRTRKGEVCPIGQRRPNSLPQAPQRKDRRASESPQPSCRGRRPVLQNRTCLAEPSYPPFPSLENLGPLLGVQRIGNWEEELQAPETSAREQKRPNCRLSERRF